MTKVTGQCVYSNPSLSSIQENTSFIRSLSIDYNSALTLFHSAISYSNNYGLASVQWTESNREPEPVLSSTRDYFRILFLDSGAMSGPCSITLVLCCRGRLSHGTTCRYLSTRSDIREEAGGYLTEPSEIQEHSLSILDGVPGPVTSSGSMLYQL